MAKVVNCPCGQVMKAETDDELVRQVQQHGKDELLGLRAP